VSETQKKGLLRWRDLLTLSFRLHLIAESEEGKKDSKREKKRDSAPHSQTPLEGNQKIRLRREICLQSQFCSARLVLQGKVRKKRGRKDSGPEKRKRKERKRMRKNGRIAKRFRRSCSIFGRKM